MEKKNIIKLLLVAVSIAGLVYLGVDQFNKVGTSEDHIDYYDMAGDIKSDIDSLSTSWEATSYNSFRDVLADIDVTSGMHGLEENDAKQVLSLTNTVFTEAANSYFKQSTWSEGELSKIKHLAGYLNNADITEIVDGYFGAKSVIANSKSCTSQSAVDNCISKANSYNKSPWSNCQNLKEGLTSVRTNALESYTTRTLIPLCNRLINYKTSYRYFDEFDADYQKVKAGNDYLQKKSFVSSTFKSKYGAIEYNNAANDLDPRF